MLWLNMKGCIPGAIGGIAQWVRALDALPNDEFDPQDQCCTRRS